MHAAPSSPRARLSVVIPTLDEQDAIEPLLRRLLPCDGDGDRPDELLVCDGGSRDGTALLAARCGARVLAAPRGRGSQLKCGADALQGDVLLFLHADCCPVPGSLRALRAALEDPSCLWGGLEQEIDASGPFYRLVARAARWRALLLGLVYGDSGLFVRRELYQRVGGFAELPLFEDLDLSLRLRRRARPRVVRSARLRVSARRWRSEGILRATLRNWIIQLAFVAGVGPQRLARFYPRHARATTDQAGET
jgi:rSAM/selenodomain-associated transferase 2